MEKFSCWLYLNYLNKDLTTASPPSSPSPLTHNHLEDKNTFFYLQAVLLRKNVTNLICLGGENHYQTNSVSQSLLRIKQLFSVEYNLQSGLTNTEVYFQELLFIFTIWFKVSSKLHTLCAFIVGTFLYLARSAVHILEGSLNMF